MHPARHTLRIALAAWLAVSLDAAGQEAAAVDTSAWACQFCVYPLGWAGRLDLGPGWVSEASSRFGQYRGLDEQGGFLALDGRLRYLAGDGHHFSLQARDLGVDARGLTVRGGQHGRYAWHASLRETPKSWGHGARTPYQGAGTADLRLPADWQAGPTTGQMPALLSSLRPVALDSVRRKLNAGASLRVTPRWRWTLEVDRSEQDGLRPFGAGVLTIDSSHLPAPVDFTTDRVDLGLGYAGERAVFDASLNGSWFDNGHAGLTWDNPFTPLAGDERLRAALEPDNRALTLRLGGGYRPADHVRLSGSLALGRLRQDEAFLPYTINPEVEQRALPRARAHGRIDATTLDFAGRLFARLHPRLDLSARFQVAERDNATPVDAWTPVITDFLTREPTLNRPYSFERRDASLEARYRLGRGLRLRSGLQWRETERSLQAVARSEETTWWGEVAVERWSVVALRMKLEAAGRDNSPYRVVQDPGLEENPLLRKFNLADRERRRALVEIDFYPAERLSLALSAYLTDDDYDQSPLGLVASEERSLAIDAAWSVSQRLDLHGFASRERIRGEILGAENASLPWRADSHDAFTTLGAGLDLRLAGGLRMALDYLRADGDGAIHTRTAAGQAPFPELRTELSNLRLRLEGALTARWDWIVAAEHERYATDDWQLDGLAPGAIPAILTLGQQSPAYSLTVLRLQGSYRF